MSHVFKQCLFNVHKYEFKPHSLAVAIIIAKFYFLTLKPDFFCICFIYKADHIVYELFCQIKLMNQISI